MAYIGNSPGVASQRVETAFTATSSQTVFTPSSGYTLGYCDVYYNGVKLVNGDDYTASDGVSITLASAAAAGDSVVVVASFPRGLTDGYLKSEADAKYVALTGNQTVAGVKTFSGSSTAVNGTLFVNTTPLNYASNYAHAQIGSGAVVSNTDSTTALFGSNYFLSSSGSDSRITTKSVGVFGIRTPASGNSFFEWYGSANGGTAGGAVALTNYAVLNQTGLAIRSGGSTSDLGVGTPLAIGSASSGYSTYALIRAATGSSYDSAVQFINGTTSVYCGQMQGSGGGAGNFNVWTNGAIQTTVTGSGRFGIGTVNPNYTIHASKPSGNQSMRLETAGTGDYTYLSLGAGSMGFQIGIGAASASSNANSVYFYDERNGRYVAAIDNNSNFYVGNTGGSSYNSAFSGTQPGLQVYGNYAPVVQNGYNAWLTYVTGGGNLQIYDSTNIVAIANWIKSSGNLEIRGTYGYISDRKLKENIVDATPKLADLMLLRVRSYNMIGDDRKMLGLIAQEVEEVFPALIDETPDTEMGTPENGGEIKDLGTVTKSIKASVLVPMLIKAMQEQQAIIEQLRADVQALKEAA